MAETSSRKPHKNPADLPAELVEAMTRDAGMGLARDDEESRPAEVPDPLTGIAFGLPVIEKFLLAVIDANPIEGTDRRARLDDAMIALFDRKASHGPLPSDPKRTVPSLEVRVDAALLWMGNQYALARRKKPADLALATAAADKFFPTVNPQHRHSRIEDLRAKFGGSYDKKLKRWDSAHPHDVRGTYGYRASEHDYVRESVEQQILRRIRDEFAATGLRMNLSDE